MARKGEAARSRKWAAEPQLSEERIRAGTGRGWDAWRELLDAWPGRRDGHTAIAAWLVEQEGLDGWWAQAVTGGYERITGLRLPYQLPDGSFSFSISRTVAVDGGRLRERLLDADPRAALFPQIETELRSRPTSKNLRIRLGSTQAELAITPRSDGRSTIAIQHGKLPSPASVEAWRDRWTEWLTALEDSAA